MPFQPCGCGDIFMSWERGQHVRLSIWVVSLGVECMPKLVSVFHPPLQSDLHVLKCGDDTAYLAPPARNFMAIPSPCPRREGNSLHSSADEHLPHDCGNSPPVTQPSTPEFTTAKEYCGRVRTCSNGLPLGAPAGHSVGVDVMKTHARIMCACHAICLMTVEIPLQ